MFLWVYGEETLNKYSENTNCNPEDDYGKSKLLLDFKVSIIRTPIIYGHGVKANIKNLVNLVNKVPIWKHTKQKKYGIYRKSLMKS